MSYDHDDLYKRVKLRMPALEGEALQLASAYLSLYDRFAKVMAISDKYHAEAVEHWHVRRRLERELSVLQGRPQTTGAHTADAEAHPGTPANLSAAANSDTGRNPANGGSPVAAANMSAAGQTDPLIRRLAEQSDSDTDQLIARYRKLDSRLNKIVASSDGYQAQLRDASARLEHMARTDLLTQLSNRRDMVERLESEVARSLRNGSSFAIIIFDIDDFKRVNDTYGHDAGDTVLIGVAATIKTLVRRSDACGRWGGEEFLILCPDTDLEQAMIVADKCRRAVEEQVIRSRHQHLRVTMSGGVALADACGAAASDPRTIDCAWDLVVRQADQALYRAKRAGKNQVVAS